MAVHPEEELTAPTMTQIPRFGGDLIAPGDDRYDSARALWNGNVDRRPGRIARCRSTADIAAAARFARAHDVEIAVRDGGHNVAGTAGCDDGIVIDLSEMCAVSVDPVERTARVQGDALWRDVDRATQAHGLATTGGIVGHTGVAGCRLVHAQTRAHRRQPGGGRGGHGHRRRRPGIGRRPRQRLPQQPEHPSRLSGGRRRSTRWMVGPDAWDEDDNHDGVN